MYLLCFIYVDAAFLRCWAGLSFNHFIVIVVLLVFYDFKSNLCHQPLYTKKPTLFVLIGKVRKPITIGLMLTKYTVLYFIQS